MYGTEFAQSYVGTTRLKLPRIVALIASSTLRIRFMLSSRYPNQDLFYLAANRLAPG
jgi:hypothetical protein